MPRLIVTLLAALLLSGPAMAQGNTCQWAHDGECDEPRYNGTGACDDGTDAADCQATGTIPVGGSTLVPGGAGTVGTALAAPSPDVSGDDSCRWALDGECDESRYGGTGACPAGSDTTDCTGGGTQAGGGFSPLPSDLGDDSCQWAHDGECDDTRYGGTGACRPGTDASDCRAAAAGGDDSCRWAFDGECDEPGIGLGLCTTGTDTTDCAPVAFLRNRTNRCASAFDGTCDEPGRGTGRCDADTDTADCLGRGRPPQAADHYFGRDDRFAPDSSRLPWRAIGQLTDGDGDGVCTATLIGSRHVLTAAHCVIDDEGAVAMPERFQAGFSGRRDAGQARAVRVIAAPDYSDEPRGAGEGNGNDWAIVELDQPLGDRVGYLGVRTLTREELDRIDRSGLVVSQAGYSWDTGDHLSGHAGCRVIEHYRDGTILHECDTTSGDSGSPIWVEEPDGRVSIIAVDSQFFSKQDAVTPFGTANLAVDSRAFIAAVNRALGR